ncbi:hypothetical protein SERLA73DRAFT_180847 [Serpula lacrymans var. lacrymans S7.3]|uniref:Secreted protein n=1 Tax=Serpula lacrymans var. lacrymans (strain S7.3) TaxID=936435 RepID=F8PWK0_SERL3|nr:hypothetical protein SERLA73DRAFT_180847 [Serpula lacrymans var. lacrymans S7.3]
MALRQCTFSLLTVWLLEIVCHVCHATTWFPRRTCQLVQVNGALRSFICCPGRSLARWCQQLGSSNRPTLPVPLVRYLLPLSRVLTLSRQTCEGCSRVRVVHRMRCSWKKPP